MISGCDQFFHSRGVDASTPAASDALATHYRLLAERLEELGGPLEDGVQAAIVGFDLGGPPALQCAADGSFAYTCELSVRDDQVPSERGTKYEIGVMDPPSLEFARSVLRQLGRYYLSVPIGHDHAVKLDDVADTGPVSGVMAHLDLGIEGYSMFFLRCDEPVANDGDTLQ